MARYGQRPENALKRANEFISVGKPARALDTLQDVFRNKKWAYSWSESVLEPIMFKYLDLCVELKRSHIAKEGLFQYRNMFQAVNVGSLENVIRGYLRMAEERTESAREQSAQAVVDIAVDDLDNLATPESLLLSAVSGEDAHDRSDRTILTPWVKFLWESYCQCLELLRINSHVEALYHDIARMAFQFCLRYGRKTEFRKLCDKLRKHLEDICKAPTQVANVSIQRPETQQLNLETRLCQLDSAIQMELWQEAYKAIEDVHGLMHLSKKPPVPKTMANYYQKLAMVFWKAGNQLFHAAALFKLFQLSREMKKNMSSEELHRMACRVVVAVLAVPLPSAHPEFDRFIETDKSPLEKAQRLAILLGLQQPPTRASLLRDIVRTSVVSLASLPLQELHNCLEVEFDPLQLCSKVVKITNQLVELQQAAIAAGTVSATPSSSTVDLVQYVPALHDVTLVRLVRQVAQVYQTIQFDRLLDLAKFTTPFHLERLLVECVRHNDMQIRIDHARTCIHFGMDLSESQREDRPEGPTLQTMPSEQVRQQLVNMATVLQQASHVINPQWRRTEREQRRAQLVKIYHECKQNDHQLILQRHKIIEDRKEYIERLNSVREEEEARRLEELQRQQAIAEHKRLLAEREERERKREREEIKQIRDRHVKEKVQAISQTKAGQRALRGLDENDIKRLDADQIAAREAEELQKERRELQAKLKSQEKKVDYLERAKRLEEIPLLQSSMAERQTADQAFWEQQESERIAAALEERKTSLSMKERLLRMETDRNIFLDSLLSDRSAIYTAKLHEFNQKLTQERRVRLIKRKQQRQEERMLRAKKEREERIAAEEAARKEREEQAKREKEEKEREEREEKERIAREERLKAQKEQQEMLDRVAAKQRQREEEVERKLLEEKEKFIKGGRDKGEQDGVDDGKGRDSWRIGGATAAATTTDTKPAVSAKEDTWRSKSGAPASGNEEKRDNGGEKKEAWKPSRIRGDAPAGGERDKEGGSKWRRGDADRERDGKDDRRDRDGGGRRDDRDDGGRKRFERDDRDRDGGRRDDRDRDGARRDDRDREGGRRDDRDRERYGGRDSGRAGDRDRERDVGGGSWRKAGDDTRDTRDRDNRDNRDRDNRDNRDRDSREIRGGAGSDWRRDAPSTRDRERDRDGRDNRDAKRPSDYRGAEKSDRDRDKDRDQTTTAVDDGKRQPQRQQGGEGVEDVGWEMQKRR